jgi:hypothetical protein
MVIHGLKAICRGRMDVDRRGSVLLRDPLKSFHPQARRTVEGQAHLRRGGHHGRMFLASAGISVLIGLSLVARDIWNDRQHQIIISSEVPIFSDPRVDCGRGGPVPIASVRPGEDVKVLRIRYGKDCQTVRISGAAGQSGWLLVEEGVVLRKIEDGLILRSQDD